HRPRSVASVGSAYSVAYVRCRWPAFDSDGSRTIHDWPLDVPDGHCDGRRTVRLAHVVQGNGGQGIDARLHTSAGDSNTEWRVCRHANRASIGEEDHLHNAYAHAWAVGLCVRADGGILAGRDDISVRRAGDSHGRGRVDERDGLRTSGAVVAI